MTRLALLAAVAAVLGLAAGGLAIRVASGTAEATFHGSRPPEGIELAGFTLRDHEGRSVDAADLSGKAVALTFLQTQCREACPIIAEQLRLGLARLPEEQRTQVVAVAVSTDPRADRPPAVAAFLAQHRLESDLRYLVGSEAELRPVWEAFGVLSALDTGDPDVHSAPVRIYDPAGEWVSTLNPGADLTPASLAADLSAALAHAA